MSTRGLIGIKQKNGSIRYIYNHSDSYPEGLMRKLYIALNKNIKILKTQIETGKWNNSNLTNIIKINYLFHEFIYILDFENKNWSAYKTQYNKKDINKGKLIPIITDIKFNDNLLITNDEVFKIKKIEHHETYDLMFNGLKWFLVIKNKIINSKKNKEDLIAESVSKKL
jgi:hypothetical protein